MSLSRQEESVQRYYDRNTAPFLRFARMFSPPAIHQPLYETAGTSLTTALHTHHRILLEFLPVGDGEMHILDLGCGVGQSLFYLADHTPDNMLYHGITLSGEQAEMGRRYAIKLARAARVRIYEGSFQALPEHVPTVDLAFAIESFIHSSDAHEFFVQIRSRMHPGGQLILFDDFRTDSTDDAASGRILEDFRTGWLAHNLLPHDEIVQHAAEAGLNIVEVRDLTPFLKLNRPRDRFVRLIVPLARVFMKRSVYCRFLVGGNARQLAYQRGLLAYRMLRFTRG